MRRLLMRRPGVIRAEPLCAHSLGPSRRRCDRLHTRRSRVVRKTLRRREAADRGTRARSTAALDMPMIGTVVTSFLRQVLVGSPFGPSAPRSVDAITALGMSIDRS